MPTVRGPVRARDLRANIKELGFEKGVVVTLEHMLEEHVATRQSIRELADLVMQCASNVEKMITVGSSITQQIDKLKREQDQGDVIDHDN